MSAFSQIQSYPQIVNYSNVDLYLSFALPHAVPEHGKVSIESPLTWKLNAGNNFNRCWLSLKYKTCEVDNDILEIVLGEEYEAGSDIQVYLDSAVDNPLTTATTDAGFMITTTWGN